VSAVVSSESATPGSGTLAPGASTRDKLAYGFMLIGLFMAVLDISIVASSLGELQAALLATTEEIAWLQTSYLIAEVVMIPLTGWFARAFSTRVFFAACCGAFTLASLLCALAWDLNSMIVFRVIQGFFGGALIPSVFTAIYLIFPAHHRTAATVAAGLCATLAPTFGPVLGGWITQSFSWHWLFLMNLLPGILTTIGVAALLQIDKADYSLLKQFDYWGVALIAVSLGALQYVLEEGSHEDWFSSNTIRALTAVTVIAGAGAVWRELAAKHPIVELRAFRDGNFVAGCIFSFVLGIGLYGSAFLLPLILSTVRGYNSLQIGTVMMAAGAAQFLSGPIAGWFDQRFDPRIVLSIGLTLFSLGLWLNTSMDAEVGFNEMLWPQIARGLAIMFCFLPVTTVALSGLPLEQVHNASGLYNLMRNLGGALGLALFSTIIDRRFDLHYQHIAETVTVNRAAVGSAADSLEGLDGPATEGALALLTQIASREALVMAYNDLWLIMAAIMGGALLLMPLVHRIKIVELGNPTGH
jgi:DHA2 family multidrug resistance protein